MTSEKKKFLKSAGAVAAIMLLSKALGFVRQAVIAGVFGSNTGTDIYFISSELMINLSSALNAALTTALITMYIDISGRESRASANSVVSKALTMLLVLAAAAMALFSAFAAPLSRLLEPDLDAAQIAEMARDLRFFSAAFLFSAVQSVYSAVLNANNRFVPGKLYGIIFNPLTILAVFLLGKVFGIQSLLYAFFLANVLVVIVLGVCCRGTYRYRPSLSFRDARLRQLIALALPMLISNAAIQMDGVIDKMLCAQLGEGVASAYTYAHTLEQFVTGIFTATVTLILYPRIAWLTTRHDTEHLHKILRQSAAAMVFLLAPVTLIAILGSGDIVTLVYQRGSFRASDTAVTAMALSGFAIGFPIIALRELMIRVYFSYQKTSFPMAVGLIEVAANALLSILLSRFWGVFGITAATSLSALLSVFLLALAPKNIIPSVSGKALRQLGWREALALAACGGGVAAASLVGSTALRLILRVLFGGCAYLAVWLVVKTGSAVDLGDLEPIRNYLSGAWARVRAKIGGDR